MGKLDKLYKSKPEYEMVVVGDLEVGEFEIPKYGSLTPKELNFIISETEKIDSYQDQYLEVLFKVAGTNNIGLQEAAEILKENKTIDSSLKEEWKDLLKIQARSDQIDNQIDTVYALVMLWRIAPTLTKSELEAEIKSQKLLRALADFGIKERNQWQSPEAPMKVVSAIESTEDIEGKSTATSKQRKTVA